MYNVNGVKLINTCPDVVSHACSDFIRLIFRVYYRLVTRYKLAIVEPRRVAQSSLLTFHEHRLTYSSA